MKIVVAGGGTAGHISPTLAVIEALEERYKELDINYIGSKDGVEATLIPKMGIHFEAISTGKIRRYHKNRILNIIDPTTVFKNISDVLKMIKGVSQSIKILKAFEPNVIFLKGGYVSVPVGLAARFLKIPYVLHESDIVPGMANKVLGKYAASVCVSFPEKYFKEYFKSKIVYTGNPIRSEITKGERERGLKEFGLDKNLKTIMVIGGSQGGHRLNELIEGSLEDLLYQYQLIHITGDRDKDWLEYRAKKLAKDLKSRYHNFDFLTTNLKDAYAVSDLIVSRAGCNVLTEISAVKKPSILVPLSTSTGDHQYKNALYFSRGGASYVINEVEEDSSDVLKQINYILKSNEEQKILTEKVGDFYKKDASSKIADEIIKNIKSKTLNDKAKKEK